MLFQDANMASNNIGVVVNPVRLGSLGEFGSPQFVADKLLQAERRKVTVKCFFPLLLLAVAVVNACPVDMVVTAGRPGPIFRRVR